MPIQTSQMRRIKTEIFLALVRKKGNDLTHFPAVSVIQAAASSCDCYLKGVYVLYAISWFLALALLAMWSLGVWGVHAVAVWSLEGISGLSEQSQQIDRLPIPGWVGLWIPADMIVAFKASASAILPWIESSLTALPSLASWLAPVAWVVWGIGFLILAVGGFALHLVISMARRNSAQ